jgi:hypothetical protein
MSKNDALYNKQGTILHKYPPAKSGITYDLNGVKEIGPSAFKGAETLETVTMVSGLTSIGANAFEGCEALTAATIPVTVTSIGDNAFKGCEAIAAAALIFTDSLSTPSQLQSIGANAFDGCVLIESAILPNSVISVGEGAFNGCAALATASLGSVTTIPAAVFAGTALETLTLNGAVTSIAADAIPASPGVSTLTLGGTPSASATPPITFPSVTTLTLAGNADPVAAIFPSKDDVTTLNLNGSVPAAGALTSPLGIFTKIETLGIGASFTGSLTGNSFDGLDDLAKFESALPAYTVTDDVLIRETTLVKYPVKKNGTTPSPYTIPGTITIISDGAFKGAVTAFTTIAIPTNVITIGANAFEDCTALTTVTFAGTSVTSIGVSAFEGCTGLAAPTFPATGLLTIGDRAFAGCDAAATAMPSFAGFAAIAIPNSVTSIGESAFEDCAELATVTLGTGLRTIGDGAFSGCEALATLTNNSTALTGIGDEAFKDAIFTALTIGSALASIGEDALPDGVALTLNANLASPFVGTFDTIESLTVGTSVSTIPSGVFAGNEDLESITFTGASTVATIAAGAFEDCTGLQAPTLPASLRTIGDRAFAGCTLADVTPGDGFSSISIPAGVNSIGAGAFDGCDQLTSVTFNTFTTTLEIKASAFEGTSIVDLTIPGGTVSGATIRADAFKNIETLESLTLSGALVSLDDAAFSTPGDDFKKLVVNANQPVAIQFKIPTIEELEIGNTARTILAGNFSGLSALEKITFKDDGVSGVSYTVADNSFRIGEGLTAVVPGTVTTDGSDDIVYVYGLTGWVVGP